MTEQASPPEPVQPVQPVSTAALRALLEVSPPSAQTDEPASPERREEPAGSEDVARPPEPGPLADDERLLDEVAAFLALARGGGEPGPESWLYRPPRVAAPREVRGSASSAAG